MKISGNFHLYDLNKIKNINFGNTGSVSSPYTVKKDIASIRSYSEVANERLEKVYGIKSDIQDKKILDKIMPVIENFCEINNNKNLFKGLILKQNAEETTNNVYGYSSDYNTKEFVLTFNTNFDWDNMEEYTKELYNEGYAGSSNPNYYLYKGLGSFLNFDSNPYAFTINARTIPAEESIDTIMRICASGNFSDFNSEYIACKMCSVPTTKILDEYFEERSGNTKLIFPESTTIPTQKDFEHKFDTIDEAEKYLKEEYGIDAVFYDLRYANECADAIKKLTDATGNPNIFEGLEIITAPDEFNNTSVAAKTTANSMSGKAKILINPAYNGTDKYEQSQFDNGMHSTNNRKGNIFIHELSHYLDFKGNPQAYTKSSNEFRMGINRYNSAGKRITGKVSRYAAHSPREFCAEYISGRLAGNKYPETTNLEFEKTWLGPEIKFPE